jgi:hypothetical protein
VTCDGMNVCTVTFTPELATQAYSLDVAGENVEVSGFPSDAECYPGPVAQCYFPALAPRDTLQLRITGTNLYAVFRTVVGSEQYVVRFD